MSNEDDSHSKTMIRGKNRWILPFFFYILTIFFRTLVVSPLFLLVTRLCCLRNGRKAPLFITPCKYFPLPQRNCRLITLLSLLFILPFNDKSFLAFNSIPAYVHQTPPTFIPQTHKSLFFFPQTTSFLPFSWKTDKKKLFCFVKREFPVYNILVTRSNRSTVKKQQEKNVVMGY